MYPTNKRLNMVSSCKAWNLVNSIVISIYSKSISLKLLRLYPYTRRGARSPVTLLHNTRAHFHTEVLLIFRGAFRDSVYVIRIAHAHTYTPTQTCARVAPQAARASFSFRVRPSSRFALSRSQKKAAGRRSRDRVHDSARCCRLREIGGVFVNGTSR